MEPISQKIRNINLADIVEAEEVHLHKKGSVRLVGSCPFHIDKTPSFYVFEDNHFKCFGCGVYGDTVDFIQRLHGLDFNGALRYLGIDRQPLSKRQLRDIKKAQQAKKRLKEFERSVVYTLGTRIRQMRAALLAVTPENMDLAAVIYDSLPQYEYYHDVLLFGDESEKKEVMRGLNGMEIIKRDQIFNRGFDFVAWLRKFNE
jgi:DNA primase